MPRADPVFSMHDGRPTVGLLHGGQELRSWFLVSEGPGTAISTAASSMEKHCIHDDAKADLPRL